VLGDGEARGYTRRGISGSSTGVALALAVQVVITGLAAGAGYGLVAISYAIVFRLTGVVHFALGELIGLAVFVALWLSVGTGPVTRSNVPILRFIGALGASLIAVSALGLVAYLFLIRGPARRGSVLGWVAGTVALAFGIRGLIVAVFTRESYVLPDPVPFAKLPNGGLLDLGSGVTLPVRVFFVIAVGIVLAWAADRFLTRSEPGLALQATASSRTGARVVGLPVERLQAAAFAAAGALAGVAAVVQAPAAPVTADTGALLGLKGLVAALIAGFGSPWRSLVAGLFVGVLETTVGALHIGGFRLGAQYGDVVPLLVALVVVGVGALRRRGVEVE